MRDMEKQGARKRGRPPVHGSREEILAAAVQVVAKRGLDATSMAALAGDLGFSTYVLVHHFGSRDGLVDAIVAHVESHLRRRVAEWGRHGHTPHDVLLRYWRDLPVADDQAYLLLWLDVMLRAARSGDGSAHAATGEWTTSLALALGLRPGRDDGVATAILSGLLGLEILTAVAPDVDTDAALRALAALVPAAATDR